MPAAGGPRGLSRPNVRDDGTAGVQTAPFFPGEPCSFYRVFRGRGRFTLSSHLLRSVNSLRYSSTSPRCSASFKRRLNDSRTSSSSFQLIGPAHLLGSHRGSARRSSVPMCPLVSAWGRCVLRAFGSRPSPLLEALRAASAQVGASCLS